MSVKKHIKVFDTEGPEGEYSVKIKDDMSEIYIKTGDGYMYTFTATPFREKQIWIHRQYDQVLPAFLPISLSFSEKFTYENWVLSKITAPNGRSIVFKYKNDCYIDNFRPGGEHTEIDNTSQQMIEIKDSLYLMGYRENAVQLQSIAIDNGMNIKLSYGERLKEQQKEPGLLKMRDVEVPQKLDAIEILSDYRLIKKCNLSYSYSPGNPVMFLNSVKISGEGEYRMEYYHQNNPFPYQGTINVDHWGYYTAGNDDYDWKRFLPEITVNPLNLLDQIPTGTRRHPNAEGAMYGIIKKMIYPTGGYTTFEYEAHDYNARTIKKASAFDNTLQLQIEPTTVKTVAGGVRIKKITDYSGPTIAKSRTYTYQLSTNRSSGNLLYQPLYYRRTGYRLGNAITLKHVYSTTDICCYHTDKIHIEYSEVTERYDDGAKVVYNFTNYNTMPDVYQTRFAVVKNPHQINLFNQMGTHIAIEPDFSPQFRGQLLSKFYYDERNKLVKKTFLTYDTSKAGQRDYIESVKPADCAFYIHRMYLQSFPLVKTETYDYLDNTNPLISECNFTYNNIGQVTSTKQTASNGKVITNRITYVHDFPIQEEDADVYNAMIEDNILNLPLSTITTSSIKPTPGTTLESVINAHKYTYKIVPGITNTIRMICLKQHETALIDSDKRYGTPLSYYTAESYDLHDSMGRLTQYTDRNGVKTCYLWDGDIFCPKAKIIGTSYAALQSLFDPGNGHLLSGWEISLRRMYGTLVTTYQYTPGLGITKITEPSGRSLNYQYNATGKVSKELDEKNQVLRSYIYSTDIN